MSTPISHIAVHPHPRPIPFGDWRRLLLLLMLTTAGCAAFHPVRGVPASYLPDQFEGPTRDNKRTIDLSVLVRTPPDQHRVAAGDVISVYVPRVLGSQPTEFNVVGIEPPINMPQSLEDSPTVGYPIQVRDDNTISLPQIPPLNVGGMTLHDVELAIRKAYTVDNHILNPEEAMVMVSLVRPRVHRVLVVRQESSTTMMPMTGAGSLNIGISGRGTARVVTLKSYENDVLHALALVDGADGLPGLNAENAVYIIRRRPRFPVGCPAPGPMGPGVPGAMPYGAPLQSKLTPPARPQVQPASASGIQTISYEQPAAGNPVGGGYRNSANSLPQHSPGGTSQMPLARPQGVPSGPAGQPIRQTSGVMPPPLGPDAGHAIGALAPPIQPNPYSFPSLPMPEAAPPAPCAEGAIDPQWNAMLAGLPCTIDSPNVIRIPIRIGPGECPPITEDMITLQDGDIVFIESRETEVFYTAGLLGGGQYTLPRDYDLGVLEALSIAEGRSMNASNLNRSMGGISALNQDISNSASRLTIIRTLPTGQRINIEVDINKAMRYQQENITVQPGDILLLQYTFPEAIYACTQRYLFEGALFGLAASVFTTGR